MRALMWSVGGLVAVVGAIWLATEILPDATAWILLQQRAYQGDIAEAVRALQGGAPGAWLTLIVATGGYGLIHAAGPGHGKYLIGGTGLASDVSAKALLSLAVLSSLLQAAWAVVLVYGGFWIFGLIAPQVTDLAETVLAPASYAAIAAIGGVFAYRGAKGLWRVTQPVPQTTCGCGHAHGPSAEEVARLTGWRDAVPLVLSVAIRPCTGAIFLLVIAWQLDLALAGIVGVAAMGLGTAILTSGVAVSSVAARGLALLSSGGTGQLSLVAPALQIAAGVVIAVISLSLLRAALG
ncbi:nickel/cobalt efflux system [Jannaschia pagri]|uniref:Nickel/cobalt efflux system n=1 Tax=Jannaschia pagri TaxID=2829797 RepID=A0ABQ4NND9_9RHOB|nr:MULTISPECIES: hypothetical protein [unclassified Jannaschia]GIT92032.1 nickel/cobalt efflux system [Jannaschia sp. AI_61]GIT95866.1 nickel/cobalt efflux system [Jannaschia sp. AI_62]